MTITLGTALLLGSFFSYGPLKDFPAVLLKLRSGLECDEGLSEVLS